MATCKDCVHCEACKEMYEAYKQDSADYDRDFDDCGFASYCNHFKNKADFIEVKHGVWVRQEGRPEAICSECGREVVYQIIDNKWRFENFCPHCGADMKKGGVNNEQTTRDSH